eukprot:SAG11_NODE_8814_length_973_cov_2.194508_1_plen_23_part_10
MGLVLISNMSLQAVLYLFRYYSV